MKNSFKLHPTVIAIVLGLSGCLAGDGTGLDKNGNVIVEQSKEREQPSGNPLGGTTNKATLAWLQLNVFDPICGQCHKGASAPLGMKLSPNAGLTLITNKRQSSEAPDLREIEPGDPESSYLIRKIKGLRGISGGRMPLGLTPLSDEQISAMETWVANGALLTENDPSSKPGTYDYSAPTFNGATSLSNIGMQNLLVQWEPAIDNITSSYAIRYQVFISNESGKYSNIPVAITKPGATTYVIANMTVGEQIFVRVVAQDIAGNIDNNNVEVSSWITSI